MVMMNIKGDPAVAACITQAAVKSDRRSPGTPATAVGSPAATAVAPTATAATDVAAAVCLSGGV